MKNKSEESEGSKQQQQNPSKRGLTEKPLSDLEQLESGKPVAIFLYLFLRFFLS